MEKRGLPRARPSRIASPLLFGPFSAFFPRQASVFGHCHIYSSCPPEEPAGPDPIRGCQASTSELLHMCAVEYSKISLNLLKPYVLKHKQQLHRILRRTTLHSRQLEPSARYPTSVSRVSVARMRVTYQQIRSENLFAFGPKP